MIGPEAFRVREDVMHHSILRYAFTAGVLITYVTILLASWRISRLNIIRAIRSIPEPPRGKRTYTLLLVVGVAMALVLTATSRPDPCCRAS